MAKFEEWESLGFRGVKTQDVITVVDIGKAVWKLVDRWRSTRRAQGKHSETKAEKTTEPEKKAATEPEKKAATEPEKQVTVTAKKRICGPRIPVASPPSLGIQCLLQNTPDNNPEDDGALRMFIGALVIVTFIAIVAHRQ